MLKGADTFNLFGFGESSVGLGENLVFGDDISCPNSLSNSTDVGGDDTMFGADNSFTLIGDVNRVEGGSSGDFLIFAEYTGGHDTIVSAFTDQKVQIVGDANYVFSDGTLIGGNDTLNNSNSTNRLSLVVGDAFQMGEFAAVNGGADQITLGGRGLGAGDVYHFFGGTLNGGNDLISGSRAACGGDAGTVNASSGTIRGGDDRITGGDGSDIVGGEVYVRVSTTNIIIGGNDVLLGQGGNDKLYGEIANPGKSGDLSRDELVGVSGGNDSMFGGAENDFLFGQTGQDRLAGGTGADTLTGGTGADTLAGGTGTDTFAFARGAGDDRVLDFTDVNGAQDDLLDLQAYVFQSRDAISKTVSGDDLVLSFGRTGDTATLVDYLATHTINQINDDLLI